MPTLKVQNPSLEIPKFRIFEERFGFVRDSVLRQNLAITMQYITYLLGQHSALTGTLKYSVAKDIIVLTGSIVEAISHYWIQELIRNGTLDHNKVLPPAKEYKSFKPKPILIDKDNSPVYLCHLKETNIDLCGEVKFQDILRAMKRGNLIDETLFEELNRLRGWRNKIHLKGLTAYDIKRFKKDDLNSVFETSKRLITKVEDSLVS